MKTLWMMGFGVVLAAGCPGFGEGSKDASEVGAAPSRGGTGGTGTGSGTGGMITTRPPGGGTGGGGDSGSGSGAGTSGDPATGGRSGGATDECPPECLRAFECAASCDDVPFNNGCCPCPAGTIDVIRCPSTGTAECQGAPGCGTEGAVCCDHAPCEEPPDCSGGLVCCGDRCAVSCGTEPAGYCGLPCSGVAPDEQVTMDCQALTNQADCTNYVAAAFPYRCQWYVGRPEPCLAP